MFSPLSKLPFHFSTIRIKACSVLYPLRKLLNSDDKEDDIKAIIWPSKILSKTLETVGKTLTGLFFYLSGFLIHFMKRRDICEL